MIDKQQIIEQATAIGFRQIGFTSAEPFESQRGILADRREFYAWAPGFGIDLFEGVDPAAILPGARSIIVLVEPYYGQAFPASMLGKFGRCYQDDDRVTKGGLSSRVADFRRFLKQNGIKAVVPFNIPQRLSAARAGLGTFGKNNFFYSNKLARCSSWVLPLPIVVDQQFEPDPPSVEVGCPEWCKNACIAACPTRALHAPRKIDPRLCISYQTYLSEEIQPPALREQMGVWVYGCDRCQEVCPRNQPWMSQQLAVNEKVAAKAEHFELSRLLHMNREYFESFVWPHMFYTAPQDIWRWHMNVARAMGNSLDTAYVLDLERALGENPDPRVKRMCAWSLGRIGGSRAEAALNRLRREAPGELQREASEALQRMR